MESSVTAVASRMEALSISPITRLKGHCETLKKEAVVICKLIQTLRLKDGVTHKVRDLAGRLIKKRRQLLRKEQRLKWIEEKEKMAKEVAEVNRFQEFIATFPKEIWTKLFDKVKDPEDLERLSKMSKIWRDLLAPRLKFFLVELILYNNGMCNFSSSSNTEKGVRLLQKDGLKLRLVCKDWKDCVDNFTRKFDFPFWALDDFQKVPFVFEIGRTAQFSRFLQDYHPRGGNSKSPFFSGIIKVGKSCGEDRFRRQYWSVFSDFLDRWGETICRANVSIFYLDSPMVIKTLLGKMKNLEALRLEFCLLNVKKHDRRTAANKSRDRTKEAKNFLNGLLFARHTLPDFPQLKTICLDESIHGFLVELLVSKYGETLENASFCSAGLGALDFVNGGNFPKLKNLLLMLIFLEYDWKLGGPPPPIRRTLPSLETISLMFDDVRCLEDVINGFIRTNSVKAPKLKTLMLCFRNAPGFVAKLDRNVCRQLCLDFPQVVFFHLRFDGVTIESIDFLLPLGSLKELKICIPDFVPKGDEDQEVIQFARYRDRLYESNIWRLFPQLRKVEVSASNYKSVEPTIYWRKDLKSHLGRTRKGIKEKPTNLKKMK